MKKALKILAFPLCCSLALSGIAGGGFLRTDRKALAETTAQNAQELIDGAKNGDTVKLESGSSSALTVAAAQDITLDLNGNTLAATLTNNGKLKIVDSLGTGKISLSDNSASDTTVAAILNKGELEVDGISIEMTGSGAGSIMHGISNAATGTLSVLDADIRVESTGTKWGFGIQNLGTISCVAGGNIGAYITNTGSGSNTLAINNTGTIENISGGELYAETLGTGYASAIRNNKGGVIKNISGGTLTGENGGSGKRENNVSCATAIRNEGGRIELVSGGTLYANVYNPAGTAKAFGIYNTSAGTIDEISGGRITGNSTAAEWSFGVWNEGTIGTISGGELISTIDHAKNAPNAIALAADGPVNSITGGTFYAASTTPTGGTFGLRTRGAGRIASITGGAYYIGKKNDNHYLYTENNGNTLGESYSLNAASAKTGYRYVLPEGGKYTEEYDAADSLIQTGRTYDAGKTLLKEYNLIGTERSVARIGEQEYSSIAAAIAAAEDGSVIELIKNVSENFEIPAEKTLTLDLNGQELQGSLVNRGTATLTDSKGTGKLYASVKEAGVKPLIDNYGTLIYENVAARIDGQSDATEAHGIYNRSGGSLTMNGGKLRAVSFGTKWGHGIVNAGTIEVIDGGSIESISLSESTASNIVGISNIKGGKIKAINGGAIYAQSNGNNGLAIALRNQGGAEVAAINGGSLKAVAGSAPKEAGIKAFGIYNESGAIEEINGGSVEAVTYASQWAFAISNNANSRIGKISGGKFTADGIHQFNAPNMIALANEGAVDEISGGYFTAFSQTKEGGTFAIRNRGTIASLCGVIYKIGKTECEYIRTENGTTTYLEGYSLKSVGGDVKYVAAENDVIVEQLDCSDSFIGVNVYRDGKLTYHYDEYARRGYILSGFETAGENAEAIEEEDFAALDRSTTVYGRFEDAPGYYFLGSSVTYGHTNNGSSFVNEIVNSLNCICVKEAISGTTLANESSNSYVSRMLKNFDKNAKIDHLIVQLSTNDVTQNKRVGKIASNKNMEDFDTTTVLGAIEFIIAYAQKTWGCEVTFYTNPDFNNAAYESLIDDLYEIQKKWGIGVIDFYNYKDMDALDAATLASYMSDAIHPNAMGYRWMGEVFSAYLKKFM